MNVFRPWRSKRGASLAKSIQLCEVLSLALISYRYTWTFTLENGVQYHLLGLVSTLRVNAVEVLACCQARKSHLSMALRSRCCASSLQVSWDVPSLCTGYLSTGLLPTLRFSAGPGWLIRRRWKLQNLPGKFQSSDNRFCITLAAAAAAAVLLPSFATIEMHGKSDPWLYIKLSLQLT